MCVVVQESLRAFKYGPLRSQSTSSTGSGCAFQAAPSEEGAANPSNNATSNGRAGACASTTGANGGSKVSRTSSTSSGHGTCTVSTSNSVGGGIGLPLATARASRRSFVLYVGVTLALERKQYHRELVSQLLAECVSPIGRGLALRPRAASGVNGKSAPLLEADEDDEDDSPVSTPSATNLNANPLDKASSEDSSETRCFFAQADAEAAFDRLIRELPELVLCVDLLSNYALAILIMSNRVTYTDYEVVLIFSCMSIMYTRYMYTCYMCRDLSGPKLLPDQIGMFIARASADGVINRERFFEKYKGVVEDSFARYPDSLPDMRFSLPSHLSLTFRSTISSSRTLPLSTLLHH